MAELIAEFDYCIANEPKLKFTNAMQKELSDEQLMLQYAKGESWAFERLYERHKGPLFRFCLRQLNHHAKAEECFQEVWLKLINHRVNYQPQALFTTYLYRIAQNHIIDQYRKNRKLSGETEFEEDLHSTGRSEQQNSMIQEIDSRRQQVHLRYQIEQLPLEQKTALLLKMDAGLSLEEIAHVLDCGRETIKSRLRYATSRLKSLLGERE